MKTRWPWLTLVMVVAGVAIQLLPDASPACRYDRRAVAAGEVWRLVSAHLAHFSWPHFGADAAVCLWLGSWLESRARPVWITSVILTLLALGFRLQLAGRGVELYCGLSGIGTGLAVALGCELLFLHRYHRLTGGLLLGLVALQLAKSGGSKFSTSPFLPVEVKVAHWAHYLGALAGFFAFFITAFVARLSVRFTGSAHKQPLSPPPNHEAPAVAA